MRKYICIIFTVAGLLAASCYGDKGSYDYREINEVEFKNFPTSVTAIYKSGRLTIEPELSFTLDQDEDNYEYEWLAVQSISDIRTSEVLSTDKNLDYFMELEPGTYALYLKVRDKKTGMLWMAYSPLYVRTVTGRGWLLIGEDTNGYTDVNMIATTATDTVVLRKLLNGLPPLRGPKFIEHTGAYTPSSDPYIRLLIATDDGSYYIDTQTFEGDPSFNFRNIVYTTFDMPDRLDPVHWVTKSRAGSMNTNRMIVCSNGDAFFVGVAYNGEFYPNPVNRTTPDLMKKFRLFPFVFSTPGYINGYVLYDKENERFVRMGTLNSNVSTLADADGSAFPWIQPKGRTLVYGENTMNSDGGSSYGNSFALMNDADGFHIYQFYSYSSALKRGYWKILPEKATDIDKAKIFAFSSKRTLLLYAVGSKLYAYDYNKGNEKIYVQDMGGEITMVRFDIQANTSYYDLYIATYNQTSGGILQKYVLNDNINTFELEPEKNARWDGLVKIVDMDWRISDK